ncbi:thrombospondin type 3 repeat-containing protein, partial [Akkermansiaceae bacterium]|nr:thrombospondin type 3 repeat-containing protein [Akkermansiaceae bacterium]MDB4622604.1 thrombospondin type 3 repeat-containing protein [Akkermansiaceae bacterium]
MKILRLVLVLLLAPFLAAKADIIYVDANADTGGDGSSWATAFNYLQDALAQAVSPMENPIVYEIWIAQGTYYPDDGRNVTEGDRKASFWMPWDVNLYGGFSGLGTETDLSQRDWKKYPTTLSGAINDEEKFWSLHVASIQSNNVFDGLTIKNGNANGQEWSEDARSGAVYSSGGASVTAQNCVFENNSAKSEGGVSAYLNWTVVNCEFTNNRSEYGGGVAYSGVWNVRNSKFTNNSCAQEGGVASQGSWNIKNSIFEGNSASRGGVMYAVTTDALNCSFIGNTAEQESSISSYSNWSALSCTFAKNQSRYSPVLGRNGIWMLKNNIFYANGNTAVQQGNYLFWDASVYSTEDSLVTNDSVQAPNLVEGGLTAFQGDGNNTPDSGFILNVDPLFVNINDPDGPDDIWGTADDGLRLQASSPAVGVGDTSFLPKDSQDLDGDGDTEELIPFDLAGFQRIKGSGMDLGAYEFGSFKLNLKELYESNSLEAVIIDATPPLGAPEDYNYQWSLNGNPISAAEGGDQPTFSINGLAENEGSWKVVISDSETTYIESSFQYRIFVDTDGDGLSDYREQNLTNTNFQIVDTDEDGLSDGEEANLGTNPLLVDTDGDGYSDSLEVE